MENQSQSKRILKKEFFDDLKSGILNPILQAVCEDNNLILELRQNYVNVYYRGGNILELRQSNGSYKVAFDSKYGKTDRHKKIITDILKISTISDIKDSNHWVENLHNLKQVMDYHNTIITENLEKEFQQLVVRENNFLRSANDTDYFIIDFEYANSSMNDARFDLIALRWDSTSNDRKNPSKCKLAIIEMKYGDDALNNKSGILDHINKVERFLKNDSNVETFKTEMLDVFQQKRDLGLIRFGDKENNNIVSSISGKPEFILLLAGHKPKKSKLKTIINNLPEMEHADLKFATASFMGYSLYSESILNLDDFKKLLKNS